MSLIGVQYLQNVVFSFKESLNGQNHSGSDSHHPVKNKFLSWLFGHAEKTTW